MKNKIALEEHFAIAGTKKYKNDVMDAPTFAEVIQGEAVFPHLGTFRIQRTIAAKRSNLLMNTLAARITAFAVFSVLCASALGQSMARVAEDPWDENAFVTNYSHTIFENTGHVKDSDYDSRVEMGDSYGRVRLSPSDVNAPFVAYRLFTSNVKTDSPIIHPTMDDFELAVGLHLGEFHEWKIDTLLGAGYSGTHPFLSEKGIFGIGDLTATRPITDKLSLLLSVDYAGNGGLLPDVPLPGFAIIQHDEKLDFMLGFPVNRVTWRPMTAVTFTANYTVPYTGSVDLQYAASQHMGFYANAGNFFQGFNNARQSENNRQFFQVRSAEAGVRLIFAPYVDASVGVGYAFDQSFSNGADVRNLHPTAQISNEPYVSLILHGRF
jgi:hypothetical protein